MADLAKEKLIEEINLLKKRLAELEKFDSERKQAGEDLRQSEERYRKQFEEAVDAIFLADFETGMIFDCNLAATKLVEREKSEIIGQYQSFLHPAEDLIDGISKAFKKHRAGKDLEFLESKVITKSGQIKDVAISASRFTIKGKEVMEGIFRDCTERKKAAELLRESEGKYRFLIENLPQKVFFKDHNSVYLSCNTNLARDFKIKAEEIKGKTDYDFFPKELAEKYRLDDKRIMEAGNQEDIEENYLLDGKEFFVHTVKTPIKNESGAVIGILGIFWDIAQQKQLEKAGFKHTHELEIFYKASLGREERIIELKKEIEALKKELGK